MIHTNFIKKEKWLQIVVILGLTALVASASVYATPPSKSSHGLCLQTEHKPTYSNNLLFTYTSTSEEIFLHNMNAEINELKKQRFSVRRNLLLAQQLWQKGLIFSDMSLIQQAANITSGIRQKSALDKTYALRAKINLSLHNYKAVQQDLDKLGKHFHSKASLKKQLALYQKTLKNHEISQSDYQTSIANSAAFAALAINRSLPTVARQKLDDAIAQINDTNPIPMVALHLLSAELEYLNNNEPLAEAHVYRALERLPHHTGALEAWSKVLQRNNKHSSAIACLEMAQQNSPDPHLTFLLSEAHRLSGNIHEAQRQLSLAKKQFQQALNLFPHAYAGEGAEFYSHFKHHPELLILAEKWAEFDANNRPLPDQWLRLAHIRIQIDDKAGAKSALRFKTDRTELAPEQQIFFESLLQKTSD